MPQLVDDAAVRRFLEALAREATQAITIYLVGGATAVTVGWRSSTIDIGLVMDPEDDGALRALPRLKIDLQTNVEFASPLDFLPALPAWKDRSPFVAQFGRLTVRQFDPYSQALAKLERGFGQDLLDVQAMVDRGMVELARLLELLDSIADQLYRFPSVDPDSLRASVLDLGATPG
jgi:hypothetical protein